MKKFSLCFGNSESDFKILGEKYIEKVNISRTPMIKNKCNCIIF